MNIVRRLRGDPRPPCMVGEGKKRDMKGDRGPRPPEAGATSEARGFRRSRNGLRPIFGLQGTTVRGRKNKARAAGERDGL